MNFLELPYDIHFEIFGICNHFAIFELSRVCKALDDHPEIIVRIAAFTKAQWKDISRLTLTSRDLDKYSASIDISEFIRHQQISLPVLYKLGDKFSSNMWEYYNERQLISKYQKLTEAYIEKYWIILNKELISEYQNLSEDFIFRHRFELCWKRITKYQRLSSHFIHTLKGLISWKHLKENPYIPKKELDKLIQDHYVQKIERTYSHGYNNIGMDHYGNTFS